MRVLFPPISTRERDARMITLMQRGSATHEELFAAQFKQWPMPGLDKDTLREDIIGLKGFMHNRRSRFNPLSYLFALTAIDQTSPKREIYVNRLLLNTASPLIGLIGLGAARRILARLHVVLELGLGAEGMKFLWIYTALGLLTSSYRFAVASSLIRVMAPSFADEIGHDQIHILQKDSRTGATQAGFRAVANETLRNMLPIKKIWNSLKIVYDTILTALPTRYYAADHELQARLHLLNTQQDRLPQNVIELYAMLKNAGIITPAFVNNLLEQPEHQAMAAPFLKRKDAFWHGLLNPPSAEINLGLNYYRDANILEAYWQDTLPALYAGLLVWYGNSKGWEKFGLVAGKSVLGLPLRRPPSAPPASAPTLE